MKMKERGRCSARIVVGGRLLLDLDFQRGTKERESGEREREGKKEKRETGLTGRK